MARSRLGGAVLVLAATLLAAACSATPGESPGVGAQSIQPDASLGPLSTGASATIPSADCPRSARGLYGTLNSGYTAKAPIESSTSLSTVGDAADAYGTLGSSVVTFAVADSSGLVDVPILPHSVVAALSLDGEVVPLAVTLKADSAFLTLPTIAGDSTFLTLDVALDDADCLDLRSRLTFRLHSGAPGSASRTDCSAPQQLTATLIGVYGDRWQVVAPIAPVGMAQEPSASDGEPTRGVVAPRFYEVDFGLIDGADIGPSFSFAPRSIAATIDTDAGSRPVGVRLEGDVAVTHLPSITGHAVLTIDVMVSTASCQDGIARAQYGMDVAAAGVVGDCAPGVGPASADVPSSSGFEVLFGTDPVGIWTVNQSTRYGTWSEGDLVDSFTGFDNVGPQMQGIAGGQVTIRPGNPIRTLGAGFAPQAFHWAAIHGPDGELVDGDLSSFELDIPAERDGALDMILPSVPGDYGIMINLGWTSHCLEGSGFVYTHVLVH